MAQFCFILDPIGGSLSVVESPSLEGKALGSHNMARLGVGDLGTPESYCLLYCCSILRLSLCVDRVCEGIRHHIMGISVASIRNAQKPGFLCQSLIKKSVYIKV